MIFVNTIKIRNKIAEIKELDKQMLDIGYWILDTGYWLLVAGCWLLVAGYWLLVARCWDPYATLEMNKRETIILSFH